MRDLLSELNPEQRRAVEYVDGPLLVLAGPGSGKTRVISHRVALAVQSGRLSPERMLGITFTARAAGEMKERVSSLLGGDLDLRLGTFHWMCHGLLRRHVGRIGRSRDFRLLSPSEARHVLRRSLNSTAGVQAHSGMGSAISAVKNGASTADAAARHRLDPAALVAAADQYASELRSLNALDLDDLLVLAVQILREDGEARRLCRSLYDEILVDEYQDTNPVQQELIRLLAPPEGSVVAVGDEDQAIYGWRQAGSRAMQRFLADFPSAAVVRLDRSYRSTKHILRAASALVSHNQDRLGLSLRAEHSAGERPLCYVADDEREEADWIAGEIARLVERRQYEYRDVAILVRVNAQSRALEDALVRHRIPYHIHAGARYYDRPEIHRVLSYLRLILSDDDEACAWLAVHVPGVGDKRLETFRQVARDEGVSLLHCLNRANPGLPRRSLHELSEISGRVMQLRTLRDAPLGRIVDAAIDVVSAELEPTSGIEGEAVAENLHELRSIVREVGARKMSLRDFVARLTLGDAAEHRTSGVTVMTIHAAKGLEFPVVFLPGLEEGLLPHRRSLNDEAQVAEERRLCYVAMTRARDRLYLAYAHARLLAGHATIGHSSRFIAEMGATNVSIQVSPKSGARPRLATTRVGERVTHPRWQSGTVVRVEGKGREMLVTIEFDGAGRQRLQLCHAPLRRLDGEDVNVLAG